jgi:cytoskeletal protein CcmA (bactofilin family)
VGVFGKTNQGTTQAGATVIAKGTCIIGGISTEGTVHIDGKFEGVILEADQISIGQTGEVVGDVKSNHLIVSGLFDGKIDCNVIQILSTGRVIGDITYHDLIIEEDGKFEGRGVRKDSDVRSRYNEIENKIGNIVMNQQIPDAKPEKETV